MKARFSVWVAVCLVISVVSFGELWPKLVVWLSPSGLQRYGLFQWGVLGLCAIWVWLKRKDIAAHMREKVGLAYLIGGAALLSVSILGPQRDEYLVFLLLLGWLGAFAMLFGRSATIPTILLAIYGFSLAFPVFATRYAGEASAAIVVSVVAGILTGMGLPVGHEGPLFRFTSANGEVMSTVVSADCSGYITMGIFLALFALMMLDVRLPPGKAWYVFLIGLAGTWLQNIIRIVITLVAGYYWGSDGFNATHLNISYFIFPAWYALFAYIYIKQAGRRIGPLWTTPSPV